jgi:hypothetical protein
VNSLVQLRFEAGGLGLNATGPNSHCEGVTTQASGDVSHAEGSQTIASGPVSHAEGNSTIASGTNSHAEGINTRASGPESHAEGAFTVAAGRSSHAAGYKVTAAQDFTYAWSDGLLGTIGPNLSTTKSGQYMVSASGGVFFPGNVGIGTDSVANALTVVGNISATNTVYASAITLSSVTFTSETSIQPMSATDVYIKVIIGNQERYLPLFALSAI